jgi:RHS repeat-associated protein
LNRLIKVTTPSNSQGISYIYNGDNLRVEKVNLKNGQKTRYLYDGTSVIAEIDGSTGLVIKTYNPGISSTDSNGIKQWFLTDGLGSVAGIVDSKQNLIRKYSYDAFGQAEGVSGDSNGYRYAGGSDVFSDDDTGLQYMWNRWYDPKIGRFLSKDPVVVGGAMNAYTYVDNSPLNFSDPMGLSKVPRNTSEGNFATIREMALDFTQGTLGKVNELLKGTGWVGRVNTLGGLLKNVSVFRPKVLSNLTQGILKNTGRVFTVLGGALQIGPAETRIWTSQLDFDQKLKYGSEVLGVGVVGTGVQIGASEGIEAVGLFFAPETAGGSVVAAIGINVTASYYIGKGEEWGVDKILKNAHLP